MLVYRLCHHFNFNLTNIAGDIMGFLGFLAAQAVFKTAGTIASQVTNTRIAIEHDRNRAHLCDTAMQLNARNRNLLVSDSFVNRHMLLPDNGMEIMSVPGNSVRLAISDPSDPVLNVVISGGDSFTRNCSLMTVILNACAKDIPVLLLHTSNKLLENEIETALPDNKKMIFNAHSISFNPFKGVDLNSICQLIFSSIPSSYGVNSIGRDFIKVMVNLQLLQGNTVDFQRLVTCPYSNLSASIDKKESDGTIKNADADDLRSDLSEAAQHEGKKIAHYIQNLAGQIQHISNCTARNAKSANVSEGIANRQVVSIDIGANTNDLLIDLLINHLKNIFASGQKFLVVLESVNLYNNKNLLPMILSSQNCRYVFSYDDVYTALNSDEKEFTSLLGGVQKAVIHKHPSQMSSSQWSKYLGEYDKQETEYTLNQNQQGGVVVGQSTGNSMRVVPKREPRVKPEMITHLNGFEACIYDSYTRTVLFADML